MKKVFALLLAAVLALGMVPAQSAAAADAGQTRQSAPTAWFGIYSDGMSVSIHGIKDMRGGSFLIKYNPEVLKLVHYTAESWVSGIKETEPGIMEFSFEAVAEPLPDAEMESTYSTYISFWQIGYGSPDLDVLSATVYDGAGNVYEIQPKKTVDYGIYDDPANFEIKDGVLVKYLGTVSDLELPREVTVIGEEAFAGNTTLTCLRIPYGVTEIRDKAFLNCTGLTDLRLPVSLTKIGYAAVAGCEKLEELTLPKEVRNLDACIFSEIDHVEGSAPDPVYEYYKESSVKKLIIKNPNFTYSTRKDPAAEGDPVIISCWEQCMTSLQEVCGYPFTDAEKLAKMTAGCLFYPLEATYGGKYQEADSPYIYKYDVKSDGTATIIEVEHGDLWFSQEVEEECTVPSTVNGHPVTEIGSYAFQEFRRLEIQRLTIPSTVTKIDRNAFCLKKLLEVTLEEGVQEIEEDAFAYCENLEKVVFPRSITNMEGALGSPVKKKCKFYTYKDCYAARYLKQLLENDPIGFWDRVVLLDEYSKKDGDITVWTDDAGAGSDGVSLEVQYITEGDYFEKAAAGLDGIARICRLSYKKDGQPVTFHGAYYQIRLPGYWPDAKVMWSHFYQVSKDGSRTPLEAEKIANPPGTFYSDYVVTLDPSCDLLMTGSYRRGDMNGSGELEAEDALLILKAVAGIQTPDSALAETADLNGDGTVSSEDALLVLKNIVGLAWNWRC